MLFRSVKIDELDQVIKKASHEVLEMIFKEEEIMVRNVYGTFAIEGMTISKDTRSNLDRIGSGQASYQQVVNELRAKYAKKG